MKFKITGLDWVVIGMLGAMTLFVLWAIFFSSIPMFQTAETEIIYFQMEFRRRTPEFRDAISVGDTVYISVRERDSAEVVEIISRPAQTIELDRISNEFIISEIPHHYDVIITARTEVTETERAFMNGNTEIRVGADCVIRGRGYAGSGIIINMWRIGEQLDEQDLEPYNGEDLENGYPEPENGGNV